jgi:2-polyprenyl-3-methyl-5-hydroxy-6-metoxy-1,4-benzoquinol methylase
MSDAGPPPRISFTPQLSLQRQSFLLETLRQLGPKSVLDVGCGEGRLLECLVHCDDALPVQNLAGVDISLPVLRDAVSGVEATASTQQVDGRWRPLEITLVKGAHAPSQPG